MKFLFSCIFAFILASSPCRASQQETAALSALAEKSDWIARVKVTQSHTIKNNINNLFYTYYNIDIFDIFLGDSLSFPLMIHGGIIDHQMQRSSAEYYPADGELLLICARLTVDFRGEKVWRPVHASAGLIHEGMIGNAGKSAINRNLLQEHDSILISSGYQKNVHSPLPATFSEKALILIRNMSPLDIHAGTGEILTVDGFGFGDFFIPGSLSFRDANKGGIQYFPCPPSSVISWSDKQIRVKVPSGAGSGQIIIDNGLNAATSSSSLNINWGLLNTGNPDPVFLASAVKKNNNGGYELLINERFNESSEFKAAFERALQTWRCLSLVNFTIKGETEITGTAADEKNIVSWDDNNQLDPGVIGLNYCYYSSCEQGKWYLDELDLLFRENMAWHSGTDQPNAMNYDFETVALHELGHAQQLSHVINQNDLMHYSLAKGQARKTPGNFNLEAVNEWFRLSDAWSSCNLARMQRIPAAVCNSTGFGFYPPSAYPNPCAEILFLDFYVSTPGVISIEGYDLRGRKIFSFNEEVSLAGKYTYPLNLESLSVSPGIYLLKLDAPGYAETQKILKN
jgi:hypothetical protein